MKSLYLSAILSFTITTLLSITYPAFGEDALYIDETGNVGIGTTSPSSPLHVYGSNPTVISQSSNNGVSVYGGISIRDGNGTQLAFAALDSSLNNDFTIRNTADAGGGIDFQTNGASDSYSRMYITNEGKIGIGTRSPSYTLDVIGNIRFNGSVGMINFDESGAKIEFTRNSANYINATDGSGYLSFGTGGTVHRMIINSAGKVGIGTTSPSYQLQLSSDSAAKPNGGSWSSTSDIRLKTDVKNLSDATDRIMQYPRPILFKWKNPEEHENITREVLGLSAQELEKANPDMVIEAEETIQDTETKSKDAELTDGNTKAIYFSNEFFALQLGAVQELIERVESLENENQLIKSEVCKGNNSYSFCKEDNK